jgi:hypothetical protein
VDELFRDVSHGGKKPEEEEAEKKKMKATVRQVGSEIQRCSYHSESALSSLMI